MSTMDQICLFYCFIINPSVLQPRVLISLPTVVHPVHVFCLVDSSKENIYNKICSCDCVEEYTLFSKD